MGVRGFTSKPGKNVSPQLLKKTFEINITFEKYYQDELWRLDLKINLQITIDN
jgi:hypothetical protein